MTKHTQPASAGKRGDGALVGDQRLPPFTWVGNDVLALIRERVPERAQPQVRSVYLALAEASSRRLDSAHRAGHEKKAIAALAGLSTRRIQEHLDTLAELGLVAIEDPTPEGAKQLPMLYVMTSPPCLDETSRQDVSSDETSRPTRARQDGVKKEELGEYPQTPLSSSVNETAVEDRLFEFWQEQCGHPQAKFTSDRRSKVRARLKDYSARDIGKAIKGASRHAFVNPDTGMKYDDLALICRNGENLERFMQMADLPERRINGVVNGNGRGGVAAQNAAALQVFESMRGA